MNLKRGILVVIEGIDGAGKTTQAALLHDYLKNRGLPVILTREPTDSVYGQKIRRLAKGGRHLMTPEEEYRLFIEDRKLHVTMLIQPALDDHKIVIMDRYYLSTIAYQGAIGVDQKKIRTENEAFSPVPDVVYILQAPPGEGIHRIQNGRKEAPDNFEKKDYLARVAKIFDSMTEDYVVRIDGCDTPDGVHRQIVNHIDGLVNRCSV
jgi:dTMP kinase